MSPKKLSGYLETLRSDAADYRGLSWLSPAKWKQASRLLRRGESAVAQKVHRNVERSASADESPAPAIETKSPAKEPARVTTPPELLFPEDTTAIVYDVYDHPSVSVVGSDRLSPGSRYFDVFRQIDQAISEADTDFITLINAQADLTEGPDPISDSLVLHDLEGAPAPHWTADQLPRQALFPLHVPALTVPRNHVVQRSDWFTHFYHFAPWAMVLEALSGESYSITHSSRIGSFTPAATPTICHANRNWLADHQPELIPELRDAQEEWDSFHHDLLLRIALAYEPLFSPHTAYLVATQHAGIRR